MKVPHRIRLAGDAARRRLFDAPAFEHLDAWVVSPGGVGTTTLMRHLARFVTLNDPDDTDRLKHWPRPPRSRLAGSKTKVLFVSGEVETIAASIERRGWTHIQSAKLASVPGVLLRGKTQQDAFRRAVARQQDSWSSLDISNVMTLAYDSLWEAGPVLAVHFGVTDQRFVNEFPKRRKRESQA